MWSWDITKLRGPGRGVYYDLYVVLDIFSRYVVGLDRRRPRGRRDRHGADRRGRRGARRAGQRARRPRHLDDLQAGRPAAGRPRRRPARHSRPHVSNDNPFSEAAVQDPEVRPGLPRAGSVPWPTPARSARRSSPTTTMSTGIPGSACTPRRRCTTAPPSRSAPSGQATLQAAYAANPARFGNRRPRAPAAADRGLDQPAQQGGPHTDRVTRSCLNRLDTFRPAGPAPLHRCRAAPLVCRGFT